MELVNEFRVPLPVSEAWELLTDPERIAPCMPGAQLLSVEGDDFLGAVKVKVGPIVAQYKGKATFQEKDNSAYRAVLKADGKESRGQGNASALVTMGLTPDGAGTAVHLTTDLTISGKAAQFGRGVLADVSGKLVAQFVRNLEADILAVKAASEVTELPAAPAGAAQDGGAQGKGSVPPAAPPPATATATASASTGTAPTVTPAAATPSAVAPFSAAPSAAKPSPAAGPGDAGAVSLLGVVAWPLLKRALPVLVAALIAVVVWLVVRAAQS